MAPPFDTRENVLRIDETKFHKSRLVPLSNSVAKELTGVPGTAPPARIGGAAGGLYLIWSDCPVALRTGLQRPGARGQLAAIMFGRGRNR